MYFLAAPLAISQHERQAKTDEMRQSKSNIVERVGRGYIRNSYLMEKKG